MSVDTHHSNTLHLASVTSEAIVTHADARAALTVPVGRTLGVRMRRSIESCLVEPRWPLHGRMPHTRCRLAQSQQGKPGACQNKKSFGINGLHVRRTFRGKLKFVFDGTRCPYTHNFVLYFPPSGRFSSLFCDHRLDCKEMS